tara:strand:- start:3242 stop:3940 length:699 start_codon:yes stop_codon:yes gene_type:complete
MIDKNVLVLGSKPGSKLPDINVDKIYTANGAAERADYYRLKYPNNELICICGAAEFARNEHVSRRIIKSKPQRFMVRTGKISIPHELTSITEVKFMSNKEQWDFQKNFFKNKKFSLFFSEFYHQTNYLKKISHVLKCFKNRNFWGVSTGFFAILLALYENPDSKVIISGIGMTGGKQFYKSERSEYFVYDSRARVDRYLVDKLYSTYKSKMYSLDSELVNTGCVNKWVRKTF